MRKEKKEKRIILLLLGIVFLMTVGFATYSGSLIIDGTVNVKSNKWSVEYVKDSYATTTGSVAESSKVIDEDSYTFGVTLSKPGDFYEATLDIKNAGTFEAEITKLEMSTLTEAQQKYLKYTVTYDGTTYSATNSNLNLSLDAGATKVLKVRVDYIQPENSADLPQTDVEVNVTGSFTYEIAE